MAMNPLPPQAYTRETLQKAYQWLLTQNSSIKEMASNQDILVSLYLKAQRNGDAVLEAPSIQNFKKELKSLATLMGDFQSDDIGLSVDGIQKTTVTTPMTATSQPSSNRMPSAATTTSIKELDEASFMALEDVKKTLNLSSDTEALRALIALGYRQFKKINS